MNAKPIIFKILSAFFAIIAISIPVQIIMIYGHELKELDMVIQKISIINWAVMISCAVNSILSYQANRFLFYTLPISALIVFFNNLMVQKFGVTFSDLQTSAASILFTVTCSSVMFTKGFLALKRPELRWWRSCVRRSISLPVWLEVDGRPQLARTIDVSQTGAFLSTIGELKNSLVNETNGLVPIKVYIGLKQNEVCFDANIVRFANNNQGNYPQGLGVKFTNLTPVQRFRLWKLTNIDYYSMVN